MPPDDKSAVVDSVLLEWLILAFASVAEGPDRRVWASECLDLLARIEPTVAAATEHEPLPALIGPFPIIRELGRGGFGVVYLARDRELGRDVAVKVPLPELAASPSVRRRFVREALAVAVLDHPNIVPVYQAQTVGPIAYIVSAVCLGPSLATWLKAQTQPVPPRVAARLLEGLARGVAHAHERGILHRDLKPANVMLQPGGDVESAGFTPRLTDFGLAKVTDEEPIDVTRPGLVIGSAPYMAPEQADPRQGPITPATDVYALGVILYEILIGRPPFVGRSQAETWHQLLTVEPVHPQVFRRDVPHDLQTICLHALHKNPRQRYPTAAALGDDLRRFLAGEAIQARPMSRVERAWRWSRRHPALAALIASVIFLIALVGFILVSSNARLRTQIERADQQTAEVERQRRLVAERETVTDRHLHAARLNLARQAIEGGQPERAQSILADAGAATGSHRRDFVWSYLWHQSRRDLAVWGRHPSQLSHVALSPDQTILASSDESGLLQVWKVATGRLLTSFSHERARSARQLAFTPDNARLVVGGLAPSNAGPVPIVTLWDVASRQILAQLDFAGAAHLDEVFFADEGRTLVAVIARSSHLRVVRGWNLAPVGGLNVPLESRFTVSSHGSALLGPDHQSFWTIDRDGRLTQRDAANGRSIGTAAVDVRSISALAISPDGRFVAGSGEPSRVLVWDLSVGGPPRVVGDESIRPDRLTFSPDSSRILVEGGGWQIRLIDWREGTAHEILPLDPERLGRLHFVFSPDGRWLASRGQVHPGGSQPIKIWDVATGQLARIAPGRANSAVIAFDRRSELIYVGSTYDVAVWHPFGPSTESFSRFGDHHREVWTVAASPDGSILASGGDDERIRFWNPRTLARSLVIDAHDATVAALAWHPDGATIASGSLGSRQNLKLWNARTGQLIKILVGHNEPVRTLAFSPDGTVLASAGTDRAVCFWDGRDGHSLGRLPAHEDVIRTLAFSPDGRFLATVGNDQTVRIWDWAARRSVAVFTEPFQVPAVAYSPDGKLLATADEGGVIRLRDGSTGELRREILSDDHEIRSLAFSPDGNTLVAAGKARSIQFWDPTTGQCLMELKDVAGDQINALTFTPDGSTLIAADHSGQALIFHGPRPH